MTGTSFVDVPDDSEFPLENLPWGIFSTQDDPKNRIGVALGDTVVDVAQLAAAGLFSGPILSGELGAVLQQACGL